MNLKTQITIHRALVDSVRLLADCGLGFLLELKYTILDKIQMTNLNPSSPRALKIRTNIRKKQPKARLKCNIIVKNILM